MTEEVKMGSYSDNYLSYILLQNNRYDYSGSAVKNNGNDSARVKKYYCRNREALCREDRRQGSRTTTNSTQSTVKPD